MEKIVLDAKTAELIKQVAPDPLYGPQESRVFVLLKKLVDTVNELVEAQTTPENSTP